jgi:LuxR family maltose regulon positive regulatory protein
MPLLVHTPPVGTKATVPRLPVPWVRRPRLNARLSGLRPGEVALLAAPAGSGKTSLLADWYTNDRRAPGAWLTIDARDNEPGRLGALVARVVCRDDADVIAEPDSVAIDRAFEWLVARGEETVLVLDDVHELTSAHALGLLSHLVTHMAPQLSLVIATRADPPIGLARLHVEGRLRQLRMQELACTADETAELFAAHDVHLARAATNALCSRTEGWVAGIRLAALALASDLDHDRFVANTLTTEDVVCDYLLEEVLGRLPRDLQQFLLRTSVAEPLTAALAERLSDCPAADHKLEELERNGLFVTALDGEPTTYRFHALFGALLRARLRHDDPALADSLLREAAAWYSANDMPLEAESHARAAGDWQLAGRLACERWSQETVQSAEPARVPAVEAPVDVSERVAPLALLLAAAAIERGDRASASRWRARVDALDADASDPAHAAARALVDVLFGRMFGTDPRSLRAVRALSETASSRATRAVARLREAELLLDAGGADAVLVALFDARWLARRDSPAVVDACDALLALAAALDGRLRAADRFLERCDADPARDDTAGGFARRLARVMCDAARGRMISARARLLDVTAPSAVPHAVRAVYEALLDRVVMGGTGRRDIVDSGRPIVSRVLVALGSLDDADRTLPADAPERSLARARRAHAADHPDEVLALLAPLLDDPSSDTHPRTMIEANALLAIAADRVDDAATATSALRRACSLAGPGDFRSPLLAHAEALAPVVERYAWQLATDGGYAIDLVDVLQTTASPVYVEPLTERERAVLEYLPTMMSNSEIALQLRVSVNTVKTHLKSVYRKLGVERRRDAVLRGRQLEII